MHIVPPGILYIPLLVALQARMQNDVATAPPASTSAVAAPATTATAGDTNVSYDTSANSYADNITRFTMLHAADLIGVTKTEIRKAKRILEIGCGAGAFGLAYMNIFPQGIPGQTIVCTDLSNHGASGAAPHYRKDAEAASIIIFQYRVYFSPVRRDYVRRTRRQVV